MAEPRRGVSVKDLFGGRFIPEEQILRQMAPLEQQLDADFKARTERRAALVGQMNNYRAPILDVLSKDQRAREAVAGIRGLKAKAREQKLRPPHTQQVSERIFTGSFGATVTPPYDYQWTWNAAAGNPDENSETADRRKGAMFFDLDTGDNNSSAVSGRAAVGIYFYPPVETGYLQIWATPAFNDIWGTYCAFDGVHADGWIGLYVGSYDLTGAPTGAVIDQQITLWSDDSWWSGTGEQDGSSSGFSLHASPIQVDQDHQYAIWVWCGGDVSADGWGLFSGSGVVEFLNVSVPAITWELI